MNYGKLSMGKALTILLGGFLIISGCKSSQSASQSGQNGRPSMERPSRGGGNDGGIKKFSEVITKDAESDEGLFTIHKLDDKYFFEIPDSLLDRDMLIVTRIAKTASGIGFGGGKTDETVVNWERNGDKILLRLVSFDVTADTSLPVHTAVVNSNFEPIIKSFDIEALNEDSTGTVIDATDLWTDDIELLGLPGRRRTQYRVTRIDNDRSYIDRLSSYPINIEARHVKTYNANNPPSNGEVGSITVEMSNSMILLPKEPMRRRYADERVGWFTSSTVDYGLDVQKSKELEYLDRWRLEVKDEDIEKFKRGELVVPKKQIVYYIDPATPVQWRQAIKDGIEDWQVAFERAGFKEAIIAKDPPSKEEDPEWSPEDARYSVVRYLASPIPNANGPHVSDPRSGEIIESDINWYHNVMTLLRRWFFVQTAAINPDAQSWQFDDEVMSRLIRFVSAHEVGHTLGLPHNFASSVAYPVDSLRSASFTQANGTAPSIMDYARFNYIAQPEDEGVSLMPDVGEYDKYAIGWGYRPILEAETAEDEEPILDEWIASKNGDPMYRYGRQGNSTDHTAQSEDLGDDAMKASAYGIANLKRIVPNLQEWTYEPGDDFTNLEEMYGEVSSQFRRYMGHVAKYVGGVKEDYKNVDQEGPVYTWAPKAKQAEAVKFLNDNLFNTPKWILDQDILNRLQDYGAVEDMRQLQVGTLNSLLEWRRMARLIENETMNGSDNAYTLMQMFADVRNGVWSELRSGRAIDTYRRNLQRAHIERLETLLTGELDPAPAQFRRFFGPNFDASQSDIRAIVRSELKTLRSNVNSAIPRSANTLTRVHLEDALVRIDRILNPND
ncbi:zinc-dependent metalloprotease [Balneola sp. MJW-20]|uniref:zinc-dependent metalloprotease n=1 Tax=Gracilimonas aurantiaca TaxID=3234185 RepID=UPI00346544BC